MTFIQGFISTFRTRLAGKMLSIKTSHPRVPKLHWHVEQQFWLQPLLNRDECAEYPFRRFHHIKSINEAQSRGLPVL